MATKWFFFLALTLGFTGSLLAQPIEWLVADGGNGHFYEFAEAPLITWSDARAAAAIRQHNGNRCTPAGSVPQLLLEKRSAQLHLAV